MSNHLSHHINRETSADWPLHTLVLLGTVRLESVSSLRDRKLEWGKTFSCFLTTVTWL
jgi:hypothetical protein